MTLKGGTSQACAACKYQRRKCNPDCPLKPYFPADQPKMFQNAHKLFGVSNIQKLLKKVDPSLKNEAMHSIKCQAYFRDKYPVHGCLGVIRQLYYQIQVLDEELQVVNQQLQIYKQHNYQQSTSGVVPSLLPDHDHHDGANSQLELVMAPPCNTSLPLFNTQQSYNQITQPHQDQYLNSYSQNNNIDYNGTPYMDSKENLTNSNSMWLQHSYNDATQNNNGIQMTIQSQIGSAAVQQEVLHDYDEIHPFFDSIDDDDDQKEPCGTSSEGSLNNTPQQPIQNVAENELKSAAACLTLTSVNRRINNISTK